MKKSSYILVPLVFVIACGSEVFNDERPKLNPGPTTHEHPTDENDRDFITSAFTVAEGGTDADSGDTDADSGDAGEPMTSDQFVSRVANTMCDHLARCCYGSSNPPPGSVDGGSFNRPLCVSIYTALGVESSHVGLSQAAANRFKLDQAQVTMCLTKIDALTCNMTAAEVHSARDVCHKAIVGLAKENEACNRSIECVAGMFCNDHRCTPLLAEGGNCSVVDTGNDDHDMNLAEEACSYRGDGSSGLHCDSYDYVADAYRPRSEWKCRANVANGAHCSVTSWCTSGVCSPNTFTCVDPIAYWDGPVCNALVH